MRIGPRLIINLGLMAKGKPLNAAATLALLKRMVLAVEAHAVHQSDYEPTLVAVVRLDVIAPQARLYNIAEAFGQEAVAAYNPSTKVGYMCGPEAAKWGAFNPKYFLQLDGSRLA
jgi:hypothetical protein